MPLLRLAFDNYILWLLTSLSLFLILFQVAKKFKRAMEDSYLEPNG